MNKKTFYVTTPIYYPSGNLHIGHVYTTTLAWVLRNYKRLDGFDAVMTTGADEHGQKIEQKAQESKVSPQEYVNKMDSLFKNLWTKLEIDFDFYSRTTDKNHEKAVQKQFSVLLAKGIIYKGKYKGLYSIQDEEFFTKTQAEEKDGVYYHPTSGHKLEEVEEESYFFKMSQFGEWLIGYIKENPNFIIPEKIVKELMNNFLEKGLEDLSISRNTFKWGVSINEDPEHVIYVWLDALNNYITSLGYNSEDDSNFKKYWTNGDEIVHIVGKEITRFHCLYWPIMLQASGIKQPSTILSHGWIVTPEGKMSKSKGNVIDPLKLLESWDQEVIKYFFASQINMGQDGIFDEEELKKVYNADLANNFGNLLSRTIAMTLQNFDQPVQYTQTDNEFDKEIRAHIESSLRIYQTEFNSYQIAKALKEAIALSKELNGYIDKTQPWTLKEDKKRLEEVLNHLHNGIYAVATMISVVMPNKMNQARELLNIDKFELNKVLDFSKFDNSLCIKGEPLFTRIK